jgi:hypothetical protein
MENMQRPATEKQKVLLQNISHERGIKLEQNIEELTLNEAKTLIDSLVKAKRNIKKGTDNEYRGSIDTEIDHVRLGLATKLVYNNWNFDVNAVTKKEEYQNVFISDVIATYDLLEKIQDSLKKRNSF